MKHSHLTALLIMLALLISSAAAESIFPVMTPAPTAAPTPAAAPAPASAPSYGMMANVAADEVTQNAQGGTVVIYRNVSADGFNSFGVYLGQRGFSVAHTETQGEQSAYALTDGRTEFVMSYDVAQLTMTFAYPQGTEYEQPRFPGYLPLAYGEEIYIPNLGKFTFDDFQLNHLGYMVGMGEGHNDYYYDPDGSMTFSRTKIYTKLGFKCYNTTGGNLSFDAMTNDLFVTTLYCVNEYGTYSYEQYTQCCYNSRTDKFYNGYSEIWRGLRYMANPLPSLTDSYRYVVFAVPSGIRTSTDGTIYAAIEFTTGEKYVMMLRENGLNYYDAETK